MISPPAPDDVYPGKMPPVRVQWMAWPVVARVASVAVPVVVAAGLLTIDVRAALTVAVLFLGMALASGVYVKNRTDRHNAAVGRGEIRTLPDPHFVEVAAGDVPEEVMARTTELGHPGADLGRVVRFDGGWLVRQRNPRDVAVVLGDDGGWARFDPRTVPDLWAVGEYTAGRGRDG